MLRIHQLDGERWATSEGTAALAVAVERGRRPIWVEAIAPDAAERTALVAALKLQEGSLVDALEPQHPPVFRDFEQHLFLIVHAPESSQQQATRKVALFIGDRFVVSVVRTELKLLDPVQEQMRRHPRYYLERPERVAHALLHHMADVFEERVDELIDVAQLLEEEALEKQGGDLLQRLHALRRRAAGFTRTVRAQRDVCQALARGGNSFLSRSVEPYLRDVADHMLRIYDLLEAVRDGILAARDSHLTAVNNQLNLTMRTLTAVATILLPLGLIASLFGMNFDAMPLLHRPGGFWIVAGGMTALAVGLFAWFRSRRWL